MRPAAGMVLIHGAGHAGDCWDLTVGELQRMIPRSPVLAVDLPGRRTEPGDLAQLTVTQCVEAVLRQIEARGMDRVMLVAHSQAGIVMPGVAERLGADRLTRLVFVSCAVPRQGASIVDSLNRPLRAVTRRHAQSGAVATPMPSVVATRIFGNGMTRAQRAFLAARLYPDASRLLAEPVGRALPPVPRTWVLLTADRVASIRAQYGFIDNLGGVDEIVPLDTCHDAMISEPAALAAILAARVAASGAP